MKSRKGFTLVELSLSMAFIATLSIIVVVLISNAVSAYHRGVVMNQLNTGGTALVDDIKSAVRNSPTTVVKNMCMREQKVENENECEEDGALSFIYVKRIVNNDGKVTPLSGAFCTGEYSYIWNSGYLFTDEGDEIKIGGQSASGIKKARLIIDKSSVDDFKLLKVQDKTRSVCVNAAINKDNNYMLGGELEQGFDEFKVSENPQEDPVDVLAGSNLAVYDLTTEVPAKGADGSLFYNISFVLGTVQGGIDLDATGCTPPQEDSTAENFDYCAINKFNFAALATRESN